MHLDQDIRIDNQRHAGIVLKDDHILLMHRRYKGREYWVIPGGHIRIGEEPKEVVIREIEEETSIKVTAPKLVFEFRDYEKDNYDYYYICEYISGEPELGGEEGMNNSEENFYEPMWIELKKVNELDIFPKFAKEWVIETIIKDQS